ncbi:MAG: T9SS type A sorting domain-containing protein, partial [Bacteroidia bacterium]
NTNPVTPAGRIKSIVRDSANNLSSIAFYDVNVDWTAPSAADTVNDGPGADIDLSLSSSVLEGNWSSSSDQHSGFAAFWYAIGTSPGDSNIVVWTPNWGFDTVLVGSLTLQTNQWYYLSVRAENGAGLLSPATVSDGVLVDLTTGFTTVHGNIAAGVYPNPVSEFSVLLLSFEQAASTTVRITDASGRVVAQQQQNFSTGTHSLLLHPLIGQEAKGVYFVTIVSGEAELKLKVILL